MCDLNNHNLTFNNYVVTLKVHSKWEFIGMYSRSHNLSSYSDGASRSNARNQNPVHPLVYCASRNDIDGVRRHLSKGEFTNDDYVSAISRAGGFEHLEVLKLLTNQPFNKMEDNERAMRWSARHGKFESIRYFVEVLNVHPSCFNNASLRKAAQYGHLNILKYLHERGASIQAGGNESIKSAVRFFHDDIGEYLVANGADFSLTEDDFNYNAKREVRYQSGTRTGQFEVDRWDLFYRVATKADGMDKTFYSMLKTDLPQEALDMASIKVASYGLVERYKLLRQYGADVNANNTASLSEAARFGHEEMVDHFLYDEPTLSREIAFQRAMKKAIEGNHDSIAERLVKQMEESHLSNICNLSELFDRFLRYKQMSAAKELVQRNHWILSDNDEIPLKVVRYGTPDLLKVCIENAMEVINTDINFVDAALDRYNFDNARILLEEGVTPSDLNMCMVNAAQFGKSDIMLYMLEAGAKAIYEDNLAIRKAIEFDHVNSVKILRAYGAKVMPDMLDLCRSKEMEMALQMEMNKVENEVKIFEQNKVAV